MHLEPINRHKLLDKTVKLLGTVLNTQNKEPKKSLEVFRNVYWSKNSLKVQQTQKCKRSTFVMKWMHSVIEQKTVESTIFFIFDGKK